MSFPTIVLENQFGEVSNNFVKGGTNQLWCNFIVDHANGNGLGIRSLKSSGLLSPDITNVYMHTSATPATGNPNPASGLVVIQFAKAYAGYVNGTSGPVTAVSGTPINITAGLTVGVAYIITSVGTSTAANWQALGLPTGVTPAVGASFIATSATAGTGTGVVEVPLATGSGITLVDVVGDPNQTMNVSAGGAQIICRFLAPTNSSTTTLVATAPADNTVWGFTFNLTPIAGPLI